MAKHSANIEMIHLKTAHQWKGLLSPLLRNYLDQLAPGPTYSEGDVIGWSLNLQKNGHQRASSDSGVLLAKLIRSCSPEGKKRTLLSILCISIGGECNKYEIGSLFLEHITNFSKTMSWDGFHIGCPNSGSYSQFIRLLTGNAGDWMKYPGKIVVTLSNLKKVGPLLKRLERSTKRMHQPAKWSIESYSMNELDQWKERIKYSELNDFGVPWNPEDDSINWKPSVKYSRVLKSNGQIIGWLICHYISKDLLRYGKLWVDPGWESTGAPLALLCDVMRSAHFKHFDESSNIDQTGSPVKAGCFISHPTHPRLHRLMSQKFKPVCDSWIELENYFQYFDQV